MRSKHLLWTSLTLAILALIATHEEVRAQECMGSALGTGQQAVSAAIGSGRPLIGQWSTPGAGDPFMGGPSSRSFEAQIARNGSGPMGMEGGYILTRISAGSDGLFGSSENIHGVHGKVSYEFDGVEDLPLCGFVGLEAHRMSEEDQFGAISLTEIVLPVGVSIGSEIEIEEELTFVPHAAPQLLFFNLRLSEDVSSQEPWAGDPFSASETEVEFGASFGGTFVYSDIIMGADIFVDSVDGRDTLMRARVGLPF